MKSMRFLLALLLCLALCLSLSPAAWAADVKAPVITGQPKALTVGENGSGKFTVQASGSALQYQWQYAEGSSWKDCTETGSNTALLTVRGDVDADGREYRCVISNEGGSVTSDPAMLSIKLKSPVILKQPQNATVLENETASFSVTASGSKLSYQWQTLVNGAWKDCTEADATGDTYAPVGNAETKGSKYRCVVSNNGGAANSSTVTLTVKLKEDEKLEEIQALTKAKSYDEAIECAESFFSGTPIAERSEALLKACVHAYVLKAEDLQRNAKGEEAVGLLKDCIEAYSGTAAVKEAETAAAKLDAKIKQGEPQNATYLQSSAKGGSCEVTLKNGDSPVLVKLEDVDNPSRCVSIYLRSGQNAKFNIKDGKYIVKFAKGSRWYGKEELFGSETEYSKAGYIDCITTKSGGYLTRWLFTIPIGTISTTAIDADDF